MVNLDKQEITKVKIQQDLKISSQQLNIVVDRLVQNNVISLQNSTIHFHLQKTYHVVITDFVQDSQLIRKANTIVAQAREKLNQLRTTNFVGKDVEIYTLSLEYDKLIRQYTNKSKTSLSPITNIAKKSRNWRHFSLVSSIIKDNKFDPVLYLKAQFEVLKHKKQFGVIYPYVSMLYSKWAIQNYTFYIQNNIAKRKTESLTYSEQEITKKVLQSSVANLKEFKRVNTGLSNLQCILYLQDELSSVFKAMNSEYISHINNTNQELSEDVINVFKRMKSDPTYKKMITGEYAKCKKHLT